MPSWIEVELQFHLFFFLLQVNQFIRTTFGTCRRYRQRRILIVCAMYAISQFWIGGHSPWEAQTKQLISRFHRNRLQVAVTFRSSIRMTQRIDDEKHHLKPNEWCCSMLAVNTFPGQPRYKEINELVLLSELLKWNWRFYRQIRLVLFNLLGMAFLLRYN